MDVNNCIFTGHLTKDVEIRYVGEKRTPLVVGSIGNNTGYGEFKKVLFLEFKIWGQTAEKLAAYLKKGKQVALQGSIEKEEWEDKDGVKHVKFVLNTHDIILMDSGSNNLVLEKPVLEKPVIDKQEEFVF